MKFLRRCLIGIPALVLTLVLSVAIMSSDSQAVMTKDFQLTKEVFVEYILSTVRAARTIYVKTVIRKAKTSGVKPREGWKKEDHAIMLPAQFVKALGAEIQGFELTLVGSHPLYKANAPKTAKEREMLQQLAKSNQRMVTFQDGRMFKGMSADFAITQGCADCHNKHPRTKKTDWKRGDFMGAIVVRMKES